MPDPIHLLFGAVTALFAFAWYDFEDRKALRERVRKLEEKSNVFTMGSEPKCPKCGGKPNDMDYMSLPPQKKCVDCGEFWTP